MRGVSFADELGAAAAAQLPGCAGRLRNATQDGQFVQCAIAGKPHMEEDMGRTLAVRYCPTDKEDKPSCECKVCGGIIGLALECGSGLGDALIVTEALHAVRKHYPTLPTAIITGHAVVFEHSPDVTYVVRRPHKTKFLSMAGAGFHYAHITKTLGRQWPNYGTWMKSRTAAMRKHPTSDWNNDPDVVLCNAVTSCAHLVNDMTPLHLHEVGRRPRLYLTPQERSDRPLSRPYWLVVSGAETTKQPRIELVNAIVEKTRKDIYWVQVGYNFSRSGWKCEHPDIEGVAEDRRGRMKERDFFRWVYHAKGILVPEGGMSNTAAALGTPCVVLMGGRSTPGWVDYPGQSGFHTIGRMSCCQSYGCWSKRCKFDRACFLLINPDEVAEAVLWHDSQQTYPADLAQSRVKQESGFEITSIEHMMAGGNRTAFLCCAGPSLDAKTAELLDARGIVTMCVNRAVNVIRHPTIFAMCDSHETYPDIWHDATITKFVRTRQGSLLTQWPNAIHADWKERLPPSSLFDGPRIPLGFADFHIRSSMLAALSVLCRLGYTTINIVGADFDFSGKQYCDDFVRPAGGERQYERRRDGSGYFQCLDRMMATARTELDDHNVIVWNCTPGGHLTAFDRRPLADAIEDARLTESRKGLKSKEVFLGTTLESGLRALGAQFQGP